MAMAGVPCQEPATVDVQAVIKAFMTDPAQTTLEMQDLSAGQRKMAKKLVEQYPELKCESFGFGQERQLHVFKNTGPTPSSEAYLMPPPGLMQTPASGRSRSKPIAGSEAWPTPPPGFEALCGQGSKMRSDSPDRSTVAPSPTTGSPASSYREVMATPPGLGPPPGLPIPSIDGRMGMYDERAVRSMPHGMFRQALFQEASERTPSMPPAARKEPWQQNCLTPGTEVMIVGLQKLPTFNGRSGCVNDFDPDTGRYTILLMPDGHCAGSNKWAKVKRDNLVPAATPQPPCREATMQPL
mmetsp:Transcript_49509/g.115813  ORF Transcript_49509/g.115813 Transcript_49509/m.115813 type:complete len:297 (-) Transcript_49509:252-1142(-)